MKKPLPRSKYTSRMAWFVWNQQKKRRQRGGGEDHVSLYWNPLMLGGTSVANGIGIAPDDHTISINQGGCNATYEEGGNPAYDFNAIGLECRYVIRQTRSTNDDLEIGKTYRFQADVYIDNYDDSNDQMLRGAQVNNNVALTIDRSNADHSGANGTWETTYTDFTINDATATIFCNHGQGVIFGSITNTRWRNIKLTEIVSPNALTYNGEVLTRNDIPLTHTGD